MAGLKLMWVRSTLPVQDDGGAKVALWDVDAAHPSDNHEVFVVGTKPVRVAATSRVMGALRDGTIEEVRGAKDDGGEGGQSA